MDIEIPKLNFPAEEVLRFIEGNLNISIARDSYASREYYNCNHPEGKHIPTYFANTGNGDGSHTALVEISGITYAALYCGDDKKDPIKLSRSGRGRERR